MPKDAKYVIRFKAILLLLVVSALAANAQPLVDHIFSPPADISRGRLFSSIEESSQVIIRGVNTIPHRVEKQFNSRGMIVSSATYNSAGGNTSQIKWEYVDGVRLKSKYQKYFANIVGWREDRVVISWNEENKLPDKIEVYKNETLSQWAQITHDTLNRIESAKVFNARGVHSTTERLVYLESNNMVKVMVYRANGIFAGSASYPIDPKKEFAYESVSRQYYPNGEVMVETLTDAAKGDQAYYYEYEYDSQGNWIVKETNQVKLGRNNRIGRKNLEHRITRSIKYQ